MNDAVEFRIKFTVFSNVWGNKWRDSHQYRNIFSASIMLMKSEGCTYSNNKRKLCQDKLSATSYYLYGSDQIDVNNYLNNNYV